MGPIVAGLVFMRIVRPLLSTVPLLCTWLPSPSTPTLASIEQASTDLRTGRSTTLGLDTQDSGTVTDIRDTMATQDSAAVESTSVLAFRLRPNEAFELGQSSARASVEITIQSSRWTVVGLFFFEYAC